MLFLRRLCVILFVIGLALLLPVLIVSSFAKAGPVSGGQGRFLPIGGSYQTATLERFVEQAMAYDSDSVVDIRILFPTFSSDPYEITLAERAVNLSDAMNRTDQVADACNGLVVSPTICAVDLVDIQIRSDANSPTLTAVLTTPLDGIFILGGDQTIAMQVIANTVTEAALEALHHDGMPIGGTSAGAAVQSRYMIGGYVGDNFAWHGLEWGAIDLWYGDTAVVSRGLRFGIEAAIIDQHFLERGRIPRLLQATQRSPAQKVGLGVEWGTGVVVSDDQRVMETAGWYAATVLDQETYHAAADARYEGERQILSIHNVAMHLLPEGEYGYDLTNHMPIVNGSADTMAPAIDGRHFDMLRPLTDTAGTLFIAGDLSWHVSGTVVVAFAQLAQVVEEPTLVLAAGYESASIGMAAADTWASHLTTRGVSNTVTAVLTDGTDVALLATQLSEAGALFIIGDDQPSMARRVGLLQMAGLAEVWHRGTPLLLDGAAAAATGTWMSDMPVPVDVGIEAADAFLTGYVAITNGLGLVQHAVFEPRVMYDYLYGRLVSHIVAHPEGVTFGLSRGTAVVVTSEQAWVIGESAVIVIDGRYSQLLGAGSNDIYAATWLLLDSYVPEERLFILAHHSYLPLVMK